MTPPRRALALLTAVTLASLPLSVPLASAGGPRRARVTKHLRKLPPPTLKNPFRNNPRLAAQALPEPHLKNPFGSTPRQPTLSREWRVTITVTVETGLPEPRLKNPFGP